MLKMARSFWRDLHCTRGLCCRLDMAQVVLIHCDLDHEFLLKQVHCLAADHLVMRSLVTTNCDLLTIHFLFGEIVPWKWFVTKLEKTNIYCLLGVFCGIVTWLGLASSSWGSLAWGSLWLSFSLPNCFLMVLVHDVPFAVLVVGLNNPFKDGHLLGEALKAGRWRGQGGAG